MTNETDIARKNALAKAANLTHEERRLLDAIREAGPDQLFNLMECWQTVTGCSLGDCDDLSDEDMRTIGKLNGAFRSLCWTRHDATASKRINKR